MGKIREKLKALNPFKRGKKTENLPAGKAGKPLSLWYSKKNKEVAKAEEMLQLYLKYIPQLRKIMNGDNPLASWNDEAIATRMYDFYADYVGMDGMRTMHAMPFGNVTPDTFAVGDVGANGLDVPVEFMMPPERKDKKPVEVVGELESVPTPFTLENLDEKIELFKNKSKISTQRYAKQQIDGFLKRLENRKHYEANIEFYSQFQNTNDDAIDKLLANYKLVMKESELFVPTFPKEAIDVMKAYTEVTEKISGEKPVFYVIAEAIDFEKKYKKLDPILLVQSPFGFFWQVLGAWDKEMLLLNEL